MTVTLKHRTRVKVIKESVVRYTQNEEYITLYFDESVYPTVRYTKLPAAAYEVVRIDA